MRGKKSELGDTRITQNGYHETRTHEGWERTARLVMETKLGRPLKKNEWVRHHDRDKLNHNPDNLYIQVVRLDHGKKSQKLEERLEELTAYIEQLQMEKAMVEHELAKLSSDA